MIMFLLQILLIPSTFQVNNFHVTMLSGGNQTDGNSLERFLTPYQNSRAPLHKTIVSLQLMVSLQTMVTTIATLLHSQSKSRNQWYLP